MEKLSSSATETKASQTLSGVVQTADSSPSKSKSQEGVRPQSKKPSSKKSAPTGVSDLSPSALKKLSAESKKAEGVAKAQLATKALKLRNKPRKILQYPDPILKKIAEPITDFDKDKLVRLFQMMTSALENQAHGQKLGIAAPQIGISQRAMIVLNVPMINPEWTPVKVGTVEMTEACYSLPFGEKYRVTRAKYGWAKWYDLNGNLHEMKLRDLHAIVFQHELDHLNGKCCNITGELIAE